ncbi:MAG: glycosyltransferase, partial [Bacteroidales bacterium]|nr:glycosyltransferase [Bacteroidales bacterium]
IDGAVAMSKAVFNDAADLGAGGHLALSPHPLYDHYGELLTREKAAKFLKLGTKARYMLFFGLIRDYKGLDWLLEAFAASGLKNRGVKLIVAGEFYGNGDKYHRLAQDLGLEESIVWATEFIPDSMVKYYFSLADIIVQPYKSATQSGVTQIGFHFRKPMLVTNVGGLAEIIPDGKVGYAVDPAPESIAKALCDFFDNERQHSFDQGIEDEVKKYSWSNMTKSIKELI